MTRPAVRLLRSVSVYSIALMAPRLLRIVTVPLVVHAVSMQTYGVFIILGTIVPFAQIAADLGTGTAALRLSADEPEGGRASLFASLMVMRVVLTAAVVGALFFFAAPLAHWLEAGATGPSMFSLVIANVVPATLVFGFGDQLRSEERHLTLSALTALQAVAEAGLTVFWVVVHDGGLRGLFLASLWAKLIVLVPYLVACRSTFRGRPRLDHALRMLRLGAPIGVLFVLSGVREFDRYIIKFRLGVGDVARYDLAVRIVAPIVLANMALTLALQPYIYKTFATRSGQAMLRLFFAGYVVLFASIAFGTASLAPEVFPLLAPGSYRDAALLAPALVFAFVIDGVMRIVGLGADFAKRTDAWAVVAVVHVAVALPLTWLLLPHIGLIGAAIGFLVATLATTIVCRVLVQRIFPLDLPVARALVVLALGAASCTVLVAIARPGIASLAMRAIATLVFFAIAFRALGLDVKTLKAAIRGEET